VEVPSATVESPGSTRERAGRILLVDDERRILNFVSRGLRSEGFEVEVASDGPTGLELALSDHFDLVILDLLMPELDGRSLLQRLLERKPNQAVIVLSALADSASKVSVLELGAEDYLSKPFSFEELLARVRARLRRVTRPAPVTVAAGRLRLDLVGRTADLGSGPISLAEREFLLLRELMRNAGRTVAKERLLGSVWGFHFDPETNVVDVYVRRLRAKLGADLIQTVRGEGYRLDVD